MCANEWASMGCEGANDEWQCVQNLGQDAADAAFQEHWASWVSREDLSTLKGYGINTVRIPVGFWIKEDLVDRSSEYFPKGGLEHLDNVVGWANELDLYVIMDLHAAPGGQAANQQFTGHVSTTGIRCCCLFLSNIGSRSPSIPLAGSKPGSSNVLTNGWSG